jgi:deoxyribose-phosphate aldolase
LKVIAETALLNQTELGDLTRLISDCGADYIKTSTGFSSRGVNLEDIRIIKDHKSDDLKIKASGGINTLDFALQLVEAGVHRLGSSSAGKLMEEQIKRGGR